MEERRELNAVLCLFGTVTRSLRHTWPRFAAQVAHLRAHGILVHIYAFNLEVPLLVDGHALRQSDLNLLDSITGAPAQVESTPQSAAEAEIARRCGGVADGCRIANPWYNLGTQRNAMLQLYSESRVGRFLNRSGTSQKYDVALVVGPDYFLALNISAAHVRAAAAASAPVVYTTNSNDGVNRTGCTNGFYIGQPRTLARFLARFDELPAALEPAADAPLWDGKPMDDYENVLMRAIRRHGIARRITPMVFFKIRNDDRVVWQAPSRRYGSQIRRRVRELVDSVFDVPWPWCGAPDWIVVNEPTASGNVQMERRQHVLRLLRGLVSLDRGVCAVTPGDGNQLRSAGCNSSHFHLSYGLCAWAAPVALTTPTGAGASPLTPQTLHGHGRHKWQYDLV